MLITSVEKAMSLDVRGKLGYTSGCGVARCGYSRCGASKRFGGIYSRKKTLKGWGLSRMRYYNPSNPQTTTQQTWRGVLASGWTAYNLLTTDKKLLLSRKARLYRMSGPNLFMRNWLLSHR